MTDHDGPPEAKCPGAHSLVSALPPRATTSIAHTASAQAPRPSLHPLPTGELTRHRARARPHAACGTPISSAHLGPDHARAPQRRRTSRTSTWTAARAAARRQLPGHSTRARCASASKRQPRAPRRETAPPRAGERACPARPRRRRGGGGGGGGSACAGCEVPKRGACGDVCRCACRNSPWEPTRGWVGHRSLMPGYCGTPPPPRSCCGGHHIDEGGRAHVSPGRHMVRGRSAKITGGASRALRPSQHVFLVSDCGAIRHT